MNDEAPAIHVVKLAYHYKKHKAVDNLTFTVAPQSIHGFVGPNGAGKTTTLRIISTLLKPHFGTVTVFGQDVVGRYKDVRRTMGFMPDHFSMYRQMTVFEYLDFFGAAYGLGVAERTQVIEDVLALTDMDGRQNDFIKGLSRGLQQRVNLARVLVHDPKLLLLDEPASGLDPRARIELMEILTELRRMGKTIFISSHILSELATLCDSVTIIDRGGAKYTGSMRGLLALDGQVMPYLLILAEEHAPTAAALEAMEGVTSVSELPDEPGYRVSFDTELLGANDILRTVLDSGGRIVSFKEDMKHLNQAFMDLTEAGVRS